MRRVALGSGLELNKLADTVRQIALSDPPLPVLICQAESNPDAWAHLSLAIPPGDDLPTPASPWMLILGYPLHEDPAGAIASRGVTLPPGSDVATFEPGVQATISIPFETAHDNIARVIQQLMISVQRVAPSAPVELALEYP